MFKLNQPIIKNKVLTWSRDLTGVEIYTSLKLHIKMAMMCIIIISMAIAAYIVLQQGIINDPDPVVVVPLDMKK